MPMHRQPRQGAILVYYNKESGQNYDGKTPILELPTSGDSMGKFAGVFAEDIVDYAAGSNIGGSATVILSAFI